MSYKRPGSGIKPEDESLIIGLKAKKNIFQDDILSISDFKWLLDIYIGENFEFE